MPRLLYSVPPPAVIAGTASIATTFHRGLGWRERNRKMFVIGRVKQTLYILEVVIGERAGTVTINRQKARLAKRSKFSSNKVCPGLWRIPHAKGH